ncbi:MAG: sugar transferase [Actinomycetota bacterium]|nr:sugar transferase [Actinomycetota bacterium]
MSTQVHETSIDALVEPLVVGDATDRSQGDRGVQLSQRAAERLANAGRCGVVWLPVFTLLAGHAVTLVTALTVATAFAAVWIVALRGAFAAARTIHALATPVAAAAGSGAGLVAVLAIEATVSPLSLPTLTLFEMAGAVLGLAIAWESTVERSAAVRKRVLIVGAANGGSDLVEELALAPSRRFDVVGIVDDERTTELVAGVPLHGRVADLPSVVEEHRPDIVVLAVGQNRPEAFRQLLEVAGSGFKVVGLPEFYEHAFGRVPVRHLTAAWFMSVLHLYQRPYTRLAKRAFDVVVASVALLLTAPLIPFVALLVRRTPGPIIFRQTRLGEGGRHFTIYKFRTMRQDAEATGAMWAGESDPRITAVGRFLRKTRLDEIPQLWNVLRGEMSIVGPRPERPEFVEILEETVPFWTRRHLVKPGITGWAQVCRGYTADAEATAEKLSYDLWYLRHRSLAVDLAICAKTLSTLVTGCGAR